MSTSRTRGTAPNRTVYTEGVDPIVVQLRQEQVRQGLSDYALSLRCKVSPQRLGQLWRGRTTTLRTLRTIIATLREGNPAFELRDPPPLAQP